VRRSWEGNYAGSTQTAKPCDSWPTAQLLGTVRTSEEVKLQGTSSLVGMPGWHDPMASMSQPW
jgi:hypothetical protein